MSSVKCQILVQNLPKHTTSKQLQQYASRYGSIVDAYLTDNDSEGFIEFTERTSVDLLNYNVNVVYHQMNYKNLLNVFFFVDLFNN